MLRITKSLSAKAAVQYLDNGLKRSDYYAKEIGIWAGKAAEMLGLEGQVTRRDFADLAENRRPGTDERLTQRTNGTRKELRKRNGEEVVVEVENRIAGYDFTFSVPKSVSIYLAQTRDKEVQDMVMESVNDAMRLIEEHIETRVRKAHGHGSRVTGNLVHAAFVHRETRPIGGLPDPHYHVHVFTFNATFDRAEEQWKAIDIRNIAGDRMFYESVFFARLADRLISAGIDIRRTETHFELASVSDDLVEKFSKRTKRIEKYAREHHTKLFAEAEALMKRTGMGFDEAFAQAKSEIGADTRESKSAATLSPEQQLAHWRSEMTDQERESLKPENIRGKGSRNLLNKVEGSKLAIDHLFERRSVQRTLHAAAMLLRRGIGRVSVQEAVEFATKDPALIQVSGARKLVTTAEVLKVESEMLKTAFDGQGVYQPMGKGKQWVFVDPKVSADEGQRNAVRHVLESKDLVTSIRGPAGSGKSRMMPEAVTALETLSGRQVVVLAPSSAAVEVLKDEGFSRSETFQKFQADPLLQNMAQGSVIWVDEAGFLSAKQMRWLLEHAAKTNSRVILSGDTRQHHAIQHGDALRILEKKGAVQKATLSTIFRQQIPELLAAVQDLSAGNTEAGFEKLDKFGVIQEVQKPEERLAKITELHLAAVAAQKQSLIVAPTHAECREVAASVRDALKQAGLISQEERTFSRLDGVDMTESQRRDSINYRVGQVIEFHQRARGGFKSGEQWKVTGVENGVVTVTGAGHVGVRDARNLPLDQPASFQVFESKTLKVSVGDQIRVTKNLGRAKNNQLYKVSGILNGHMDVVPCRGGDKRPVRISTEKALHIDQGIAVTSHASQGKTVDQVIASVPVSSFAQINQAAFYVLMSRARSAMHLFTDSKEALRVGVCRPSDRLSPSEIDGTGNAPTQKLNLVNFCIDLHRKFANQIKRRIDPPGQSI